MTPRRRQRGVKVALGGAASVGALLLALVVAVPALPDRSQRLLCAAVRGICSVIAPEVECAPIPPRPLDGQAPVPVSGCPRGWAAINGGCWAMLDARPPCPALGFENPKDGRCYTPLMLPDRKPPIVPTSQEP
jgi:hypothetical protein